MDNLIFTAINEHEIFGLYLMSPFILLYITAFALALQDHFALSNKMAPAKTVPSPGHQQHSHVFSRHSRLRHNHL